MGIKDDLVQFMELDAEILETEQLLKSKRGLNPWVYSRYQDGVSTRLSAIYSEHNPKAVTRLQQQRDDLAAQIENMLAAF